MSSKMKYLPLMIVCCVLLMASCVQYNAGDPLSTPVSQGISSPTPTLTPTIPPPATNTLAPLPSMTADLSSPGDFGAQSEDTGIPDTTTDNSTTDTTGALNTQGDPLQLTATARIQQATVTQAVLETATALAQGIGIPNTETPTPSPTNQTGPGPSVGADCVHQVVQGDTLFSLSRTYGITVTQLAARNGIVINGEIAILTVGNGLIIPNCGTTGVIPPPTSTVGPTITPFGYIPPTTSFVTPGALITSAGPTALPVDSGRRHIVREGETLFQIAQIYNTTAEAIAYVNNLPNIDQIRMGQELIIPN